MDNKSALAIDSSKLPSICADPALEKMISSLYAMPVETATASPSLLENDFFPEELAYVNNSVEKRRAEFLTVRNCARVALARLDGPNVPFVPHSDRSPIWPKGFIGSLTHSHDICAAVVTRKTAARSIGIDIEEDASLAVTYFNHVCTKYELENLLSQPEPKRGKYAKIIFSAKEAFYKCQYAVTNQFLDFKQVELEVDFEAEKYTVASIDLPESISNEIQNIHGRFVSVNQAIITTATM